MISHAEWLNPTRFVGLIAHFFAAACCGMAWTRSRGFPGFSRLAAVLTLLEAGLFLDIAFSVRWQLHDSLEGQAIRENLYAQRAGPQLVALVILGAVAAAGMVLVFQHFRGRNGATVAACGAILSLVFWCAEVISLHATDAVLHHMVGGFMLVGLCWLGCSTMTGAGILWDARAARADVREEANSFGEQPSSITGS
jgi:hypothetical protein